MATQLHILHGQQRAHPAVKEGHHAHPAAKILELNQRLQRHLELDALLHHFDALIREELHHDGMRFHSPHTGVEIAIRGDARHSCSYQMEIEGEQLGELRFFRGRRFTEHQLKGLEKLLAALMYPLRNAIKYFEAVRSAYIDPLTGVGNRAAMDHALVREVELARRQGAPLSVILFDIDFFKRINDDFGHGVGDTVLREVARCVGDGIRRSDLLFRYGGEEFLVLLSHTGADGAALLAERLRQRIIDACPLAEDRVHLSISLGVAELHDDEEAEGLVRRADTALYRAKHGGRNRTCRAD